MGYYRYNILFTCPYCYISGIMYNNSKKIERNTIVKRNSATKAKMIPILVALGLLTACRGEKTGTASTTDYDTNAANSTEIEYLGTEDYEIKGNHHALTDEEKQEKYQRYLKEVLSNR